MLVGGECRGTRPRVMEMPLIHISSQNSYGPTTYLCVLQRFRLAQDAEVNDFIFGLLNRRRQGKKWQISDRCQSLRHRDLSSPPYHGPVSNVPFQNTFKLQATDVFRECILLVRSPQPTSFRDHDAGGQRKTNREGQSCGGCFPHIPLCPVSRKIPFASPEGLWWSHSSPHGVSSAQQKVSRRDKTQPSEGRGGDQSLSSCARIWRPQQLGIQRKKHDLLFSPSHALRSQSSHQEHASPRCPLGWSLMALSDFR